MKYIFFLFTLLISGISYTQEFDERLTLFEIDKKISESGGNVRAMAKESLKRQRDWNKERRQEGKLPKELKIFTIGNVTVTNTEIDGSEGVEFSSIWYHRIFGITGGTYTEMNFVPIKKIQSSESPKNIITTELALRRIEEAKRLLELEIITQKEYDSIFNVNSKIIREKRIEGLGTDDF